MDRIKAELSEGPVAPVYDTNTGPSEYLLSFDSSSHTLRSLWNTVEHLGRCPVAQGLIGPQVIVEPEVFSQPPAGLIGVGVGFQVGQS